MLYAIALVCILILDQALKYYTILNIIPGNSKELLPGFLELTNVHNTGAAFGMIENGRWFFIVLTAILAVVIIVLLARDIITGRLARFSLLAILAGGIGNCIDRIVNGYVVDMFHFDFLIFGKWDFPVFNVADIFVTVFGIIFCFCLVFGKVIDKEEVLDVLPGKKHEDRKSQNVDYISQLKKTVVEGKEAIEQERAARATPTAVHHAEDTGFGAWNLPISEEQAASKAETVKQSDPEEDAFFESRNHRPAAPAPLGSEPNVSRPAAPTPLGEKLPEAKETNTTFFDDPFKDTKKSAAPAKGEDEFNLDNIIAEFKD